MSFYKDSFLSLILRASAIIGKFGLLFLIARNLPVADLGVYGLFLISISLLLYILGLDFYVFNTREILSNDSGNPAVLIKDQLVLHLIIYLIVFPLASILFFIDILEWKYLIWFYVLLLFEHLSQELTRLLITLTRPVSGNIVLFIRSGIWVYVIIAIYFISTEYFTLSNILKAWSVGAGLSVVFGGYYLKNLDWGEVRFHDVNWMWIKKGITTSLYFLGASIFIKAIEYADRFFIQFYHGEDLVGVYTFFISLANVIQTFAYTGIVAILFPPIVSAYQSGDMTRYRENLEKMAYYLVGSVLVYLLSAYFLLEYILQLVDKPIYREYVSSYWIMVSSVSFLVISLIPHYALYVRKLDRSIFYLTGVSLVIVLILNYLLVPDMKVIGAALSTLTGMIFLFVSKSSVLLIEKLSLNE